MKITCKKTDLEKGVNIVSKAVPARTTKDILYCIVIDASAGEIKLIANNTELGIETVIDGNIEERGIIAINANKLAPIVSKLPDTDITLETNDSFEIFISYSKAGNKQRISGRNSNEFPYLPDITRNQPIIISQLTFKDIIKQTIFSVADNDNNKLMTGELLEIKNNNLKVVALDGHRVSIRNVELKNPANDVKVIIPKKTLNEITKIINGGIDDEVSIYVIDNHVIFEFDKTTVVSRVIEGEFFKIEQMLSNNYETKIKINKRLLLETIDRSTPYVHEGDKKPIIINVKDNIMSVSISSNVEYMNEDIDIDKEGKDIMIGFNPKFVMDALKVIDDEDVNLYMMNAKTPCFIKDDEGKYIYIILPVNFNNPGAN